MTLGEKFIFISKQELYRDDVPDEIYYIISEMYREIDVVSMMLYDEDIENLSDIEFLLTFNLSNKFLEQLQQFEPDL